MSRQSGITLIEVLVAVLVLAIGLLGIAGLQTAALSTNFNSYQYTQASFLAESMLERMRANRQAYASGNSGYNLSAGTAATVSVNCYNPGTACTAAQQAQWDMGVWYSQVTGSAVSNAPRLSTTDSSGNPIGALPSGAVSISCPSPFPTTGPGICTITVYWDPNRSASSTSSTYYSCSSTDSTALACFRLSALLP